MSLAKVAQIVPDDISPNEFLYADDEAFEDEVEIDDVLQADDVDMGDEEEPIALEVSVQDIGFPEDQEVIVLTLPAIPGSDLSEEELADIVVDEPEDIVVEDKPSDPWDWKHFGLAKFFDWTNERINGVPRHSGHDISGIDRAVVYLETLKKSISSAVKTDLKGELDIAKIETIIESIEDGIERLEKRRDQLAKGKDKKRKKKAGEEFNLTKTAQRATSVGGIIVTVPLLISRIARVCINGHVSAGKDIEELFREQSKKYKLTDREKAETVQLIDDMGYPVFRDRGFLVDEDYDRRSENNFDNGPTYPA